MMTFPAEGEVLQGRCHDMRERIAVVCPVRVQANANKVGQVDDAADRSVSLRLDFKSDRV